MTDLILCGGRETMTGNGLMAHYGRLHCPNLPSSRVYKNTGA